MDLIIQPTTGEQFTINMWHFDTVHDIRQEIQKKQGIPISTQTLVFNGNVLEDEHQMIYDLGIAHDSHIQLIIAPDQSGNQSTNVLGGEKAAPSPGKRSISTEDSSKRSKKIRIPIKKPSPNTEKQRVDSTEESSSSSKRNLLPIKKREHSPTQQPFDSTEESSSDDPEDNVRLRFKMPSTMSLFALEMATSDTVRDIKEQLQDIEGHHWSRYILHTNGIELLDDKTILESGLTHMSETEVSIKNLTKAELPGPTGDVTFRPKKLRVLISTPNRAEKTPVVVTRYDKVYELRKELEKLSQESKLELPPEYFFMHNRKVMRDDRTFRWHSVKDDDVVECVPGRATTGSS